MRIAIVNDMQMAVEVLRRIVSSIPGYNVAWIAYNGVEAVRKCAADTPDLILMDLIMPEMDGVEATRLIMKYSPCAILVVTATVTGNAGKVFDAMGHGALDAVNTPVVGTSGAENGRDALLTKIATIGKLIGKEPQLKTQPSGRISSSISLTSLPPLVVIGASTGGPLSIGKILSQLPKDFPGAVLIIQHVDVEFAQGLADWLNEQTALDVRLAEEGRKPEPGKAFIAGTNDHLVLTSMQTLSYTKEPADFPYRPSVDVFFKSVAQHCSSAGIAILLTGMGKDGAAGLLDLKRQGWHTIAQDKESSIVYGMPKAAAELGAATEILPVERIASAVLHVATNQR